MHFRWRLLGLLLGAASASLAVLPLAASAQGNVPDNFYAGKTISIIVDGTGAYETYARTLARHLPRHIPGQPKIIVQAMPGASGLRAATYLYKVAPRDGTVIGGLRGALLTAPLFSPDVAQFDLTQILLDRQHDPRRLCRICVARLADPLAGGCAREAVHCRRHLSRRRRHRHCAHRQRNIRLQPENRSGLQVQRRNQACGREGRDRGSDCDRFDQHQARQLAAHEQDTDHHPARCDAASRACRGADVPRPGAQRGRAADA